MTDYKKMYLDLYNSVGEAIILLQTAQKDAEESYISACDDGEDSNLLRGKIDNVLDKTNT